MLRVTKLTDYAIVILTHLARVGDGSRSARDIAGGTHIPVATVSKILKELARKDLLVSQRGVKGGYRLARAPQDVGITEVIAAIEGPVAMTECCADGPGCEHERTCEVSANWGLINAAVRRALSGISLADMAGELDGSVVSLHREPRPVAG